MARSHWVLVATPGDRASVETALGAVLGAGWGRGCLVPVYAVPPTLTAGGSSVRGYACCASLTLEEAAKIAQVAASVSAGALTSGAVARKPTRTALADTLTAHEAKGK